jgi:transposase
MRDIREVLPLTHEAGLSQRQLSASLRIAPSTVHRYLERAERPGLDWPLPEDCDGTTSEQPLFPPVPPSTVPRTPPDFGWVHRELRRKGVTLQLLHIKQAQPGGYQYSQFCELCWQWAGRFDLVTGLKKDIRPDRNQSRMRSDRSVARPTHLH